MAADKGMDAEEVIIEGDEFEQDSNLAAEI